ncbi:bactericidal permeability-increasing protein-like [Spea bombifrons]|uniref:bactericidal permeability-increasing protein-like n=1 Tax=Spea bombifrons TaxID=233779 RepID=UPI002349AB7B|nr:bactericidal permeability-increasing protein-like [Spea bombifrons]
MKFLLLLVLCCPSEAGIEKPGVRSRLTLKGLQYGWRAGMQELEGRLPSLQIPDVSGSIAVPVIGPIVYSVTGLQIQDLDLSNSNVSFISDTGLKAEVSAGQLRVTGNLKLRTFLFTASTILEVSVRGLSFTGLLGVTSDDSGRCAVWDGGCSSNVGQVDIGFHGGSGWLFYMFRDAVAGPVHDALSTQICPEFSKRVQQMEEVLSNMPVTHIVDSVSFLEFPLVGLPLITEGTIDFFVKGQFAGHSQHWDFPEHPEKLVLPDIDSRMFLLALSQFTANSAGYVHYKSGILERNITDDEIPKGSPLRLNTRSLSIFVPELLTRFPDSPPLLLHVSARSPPVVSCQPDLLTLETSMDIRLFAMYPEQPPTPIFQIQAELQTQVDILLSDENMGAALTLKNLTLTLVRSDAGPVKVDSMRNIFSLALKVAIFPLVNARLRNVFTFPTSPVRLQNPVVNVLKGYLLIVSDLEMSP